MRTLPRIHIPSLRRLVRRVRQWWHHITVARAVLMAEGIIFLSILLFALAKKRTELIGHIDRHEGMTAAIAILAIMGLAHMTLTRRIISAIELRLSPPPYDERQILFDLGQEARAATDIDHLYRSIVGKIGDILQTDSVSIFVRDDSSGDYFCRITTAQHADSEDDREKKYHASGARLFFKRDAFIVKRLQHLMSPLLIEPGDFETWDRAFVAASATARETRKREMEMLRRIDAKLIVQIKIKEQLAGILSLGPRRAQHQYSTSDKEMLLSVAGQLAFVIENSKLVERMVAEEQLRRELAWATEVQQQLFPKCPPIISSAELSGFCQPARGVGGDYYDFLVFENEQVGIAIADVAGKGISAALLMSNVQASLRSQAMMRNAGAPSKGSLAALVSDMNTLLCRSTGPETYVTFFYSQLDARTRQLTYVNAGHNPPIIVRPSLEDALGSYVRLTAGGPVIGMFESFPFEEGSVELESGDLLVAFTDGVTEAMNTDNEEFGEERLLEILASAARLPADEIREIVVQNVKDWCNGAPQHDDLTFIILKIQ
jgi:phosphoserine phosphatase RsbU/P